MSHHIIVNYRTLKKTGYVVRQTSIKTTKQAPDHKRVCPSTEFREREAASQNLESNSIQI